VVAYIPSTGRTALRLVSQFHEFLRVTVNLNRTRIDNLECSVEAIQTFIKDSAWTPRVWKFEEQGSWAHDTIIKPCEGKEFDADLLVIVEPMDEWSARDYVKTLGDVFKASGVYRDKVEVWDYCVTVTYSTHYKIDIAPTVRGREVRDQLEVCNRAKDEFERSEPVLYTAWLREKNGYSGANSFRKVTRLVKYLRDITRKFDCPSVLLTTLLAEQIQWNDKDNAAFKDVPTTLKTVFGRLDDWLQLRPKRPIVSNPSLATEDFAAGLSQAQYETLRATINSLRDKIDEAYDAEDRQASIRAWQDVFGTEFAKGAAITAKADLSESEEVEIAAMLSTTAAHDDALVDRIAKFGRWLWNPSLDHPSHMLRPIWKRADTVTDRVTVLANWQASQHAPESQNVHDFDELSVSGGLWFDVRVNDGQLLPAGFSVRWRVTNTGVFALSIGQGRGEFNHPTLGNRRWEKLCYRGVHLTEAFIIRDADNKLVGQSPPFHVMIR
jgi:hypothetical protein